MYEQVTVLKSVEVLPLQDAANVCWLDRVSKDGETIAEVPSRKAYGREQKEDFLIEVEGAAFYVSALGW